MENLRAERWLRHVAQNRTQKKRDILQHMTSARSLVLNQKVCFHYHFLRDVIKIAPLMYASKEMSFAEHDGKINLKSVK